MKYLLKAIGITIAAVMLSGCSTPVGSAVVGAGQSALQAIGLAPKPDQSAKPQPLRLQIYAGDRLNSDDPKRGYAVVMRLYALRSADDFEHAGREELAAGSAVPSSLKEVVLGSREQVLLPGQRYQLDNPLPAGTQYLGIAVMFSSAKPSRWRATVPVSALADALVVGVHRCSFTINDGLKDKELQSTLALSGAAGCS